MPDRRTDPVADPFFDTLDRIGSPIFVVERVGEADFRLVHLNRSFRTVADLDPCAMTSGPVREILPRRTADVLTANCLDVLSRSEPLCYDETQKFGDRTITWRTTLSRICPAPSGRDRIVGTAVPVSDLIERTEALAAEIAELRARHEELSTLARLAAHDMRAPLANVQSLTEMVLEGHWDPDDGKAEMIRACRDVAETALASIGTLMDRFRPGPPARRPEEALDLDRTCCSIVTLADPAQRLETTWPAARLVCDSTVLTLALRNLVDNAARFASARIDIALSTDPATGHLVLAVADDGPGLPAGVDPLRQALAGETREDGRGYGLGAVMSLLGSRGGELRVAPSRLGGGATFEIVLPGRILGASALARAG